MMMENLHGVRGRVRVRYMEGWMMGFHVVAMLGCVFHIGMEKYELLGLEFVVLRGLGFILGITCAYMCGQCLTLQDYSIQQSDFTS